MLSNWTGLKFCHFVKSLVELHSGGKNMEPGRLCYYSYMK